MVRQVFAILLENAIKYADEQGKITVSLARSGHSVRCSVKNSGRGIGKNDLPKIFDRFYRVDKARSRGTGGTGLGLSITKNAVHMHKGAIKVYSKENEGTTFTVRVPINYIA